MIDAAPRMALAAERELEALVGVSSPSGDLEGAEECVALATAFLPTEAEVERLECSTSGHAHDLLGRLRGSGERRVLLLGHLDTVVSNEAHRPLTRDDGDRLTGSGAVDMKGGVALSLGVMRELAARPELFAEAVILLVNDEEWRTAAFAHAKRFADFDACLCFEAGERSPDGRDAVTRGPAHTIPEFFQPGHLTRIPVAAGRRLVPAASRLTKGPGVRSPVEFRWKLSNNK